ncbi:diguanylate cyclase (GGDEF) domain-containing protein [Caloramator fervidus]|uniref:Stage 0 sporulation protein A homolog n=1 Tax=Caloramator fervidus TaxID=29344 RepID=A0A1H5SNV9_9CLOT|nr:diguanylate cyclase [Caloramator fervidus]SEF51437.1 diguanylate cyclase (GGDEF) domain-containing protein [Caloramator fervidus]
MTGRILIIEDSMFHGKVLSDMLIENKYQVKWVRSGEEVLSESLDNYDLVLIDLILPGIDGYSLCEILKKEYPYLPIIAITSITEEESVSKALSLGADDYIKKPFSLVELLARINVQLRTRRLQLELIKKNNELKIAYDKIKKMAITDMLTGAYNRAYLREYVENLLQSSSFVDINCFLIDIDNFKKINDTYGHLIGDEILKRLVDICKRNIKDNGIIIRFGGEEFLGIIYKEADAYKIAENIRDECQKDCSFGFVWTVSIGLSKGIITSEKDIEFIIKKADDMLYEAKKSGKNKVKEG